MYRSLQVVGRAWAPRACIGISARVPLGLIHHQNLGHFETVQRRTFHFGRARLTESKHYLGHELPTPYGDDTPGFKRLFNIGNNPYNWQPPVELIDGGHSTAYDGESDAYGDDPANRAMAEALNAKLFARDFEGSPEQNMNDAFQRLGLLGSQDGFIPGTCIKPMSHQVIGIDWMLQRENSESRGGILGDDMGLGKTPQSIGLMMLNQPKEDDKRKSTLILVPTGLLQQWKDEIEHYSGRRLSVFIYHGTSRTRPPHVMRAHDVVLSTVGTVRHELANIVKQRSITETAKRLAHSATCAPGDGKYRYENPGLDPGGLHSIKWHRIIVDEAHDLRNRHGKGSQAVCNLDARYRWCLTGTPIFNVLADLYSLLRFLRIPPSLLFDLCESLLGTGYTAWHEDKWRLWKDFIQDKEKDDAIVATRKVRAMLKPVLLRRTKASTIFGKSLIKLPQVHVVDQPVALCRQEDSVYRYVEGAAQDMLLEAEKKDEVFSKYEHILSVITRMRQSVCHYGLLPWSSTIPDITHPQHDEIDLNTKPAPSSKTAALRRIIEKVPSGEKIIVVSSFVKLLELIRPYLERVGFKTVIYTGRVSPKERLRALENFKKDKSVRCLLLSIKAGGTGLNLTEANHMVLMDLAWNPATEQQSLGRINRIGQDKEVYCTRLIVQDTIEDRMKALQADKQRLSDETLGIAQGFKLNYRKLDLTQLKFLFGLDASGRKIVKDQKA